MDYKQMVLDYLEGKMPYPDFQNEIDKDGNVVWENPLKDYPKALQPEPWQYVRILCLR